MIHSAPAPRPATQQPTPVHVAHVSTAQGDMICSMPAQRSASAHTTTTQNTTAVQHTTSATQQSAPTAQTPPTALSGLSEARGSDAVQPAAYTMQQQVGQLTCEMDRAAAQKDYIRAAKFQQQILALGKRAQIAPAASVAPPLKDFGATFDFNLPYSDRIQKYIHDVIENFPQVRVPKQSKQVKLIGLCPSDVQIRKAALYEEMFPPGTMVLKFPFEVNALPSSKLDPMSHFLRGLQIFFIRWEMNFKDDPGVLQNQ